MKNLTMVFAVLTFSILVHASEPKVIISPVNHLFVPSGFDNNDNVEVIVTGQFPSPCYITNKVDVKQINDKIFITVTALQRESSKSDLCEPMVIPFKEEITVGNLQGGDYEIIVNEKTPYEQKEKLNVAVSSSTSVDDHLYPIVEYIELGFTGGLGGDALLHAKVPSDCLVFERVDYLSNNKDTISILPIMKKVSSVCNEGNERIQIPVKFKLRSLSNKAILIYVRSIEGKSANTIINR